MKTRFAPSPTGYLHIGNVRTALLCWLYARKQGGTFMLRIDDTDKARSKDEYITGLKEDLRWLGLNWDEELRQSERFAIYNAAVEKLKAAGRLYPCYETGEELEIKRKMQLSRGKPPIYDRGALTLPAEKKTAYEVEGRVPHWRLKLKEGVIAWNDLVRGPVQFDAKNLSDPILIREDGSYLYMLPSAVDDMETGITHVIRGEDHISNTAIQIQLFEALGGTTPAFSHNSLIKTKEGKLSKREGSFTLRSLRDDGIEPMAINSFLAKIGTSDAVDIRLSLDELRDEFAFEKLSHAPTMYEPEEITRLNSKLLHQLPFSAVKARFADMGIATMDEEFWNAVRTNIATLHEVKDWWRICREEIAPVIAPEDKDFCAAAAEAFTFDVIDENTWNHWTTALKEKTGRKGKDLFMPLRKAITGMEHGPELKILLPLLGKEKIIARLQGKAA